MSSECPALKMKQNNVHKPVEKNTKNLN